MDGDSGQGSWSCSPGGESRRGQEINHASHFTSDAMLWLLLIVIRGSLLCHISHLTSYDATPTRPFTSHQRTSSRISFTNKGEGSKNSAARWNCKYFMYGNCWGLKPLRPQTHLPRIIACQSREPLMETFKD